MVALLVHPFRLRTSGAVATAEQGSDRYIDSQLQVVIGTRLGERGMCPSFGVPDAAFARLSAADIQTCLDRFGPDGVVIASVTTTLDTNEFTDTVNLQWSRTGIGGGFR